MTSDAKPPCGDEAVRNKTGRDWATWCALLDGDGAAAMSHPEIVAIVHDKYDGGSWWSQMVAVGYERLRGLRQERQGRDGAYAASASKIVPAGAARAHDFFTDEANRRRWLDMDVTIRTARRPVSVRMTWPDNSIVAVWITEKGDAKCNVAIEHGKLLDAHAVEATKAYWKETLGRLTEAVA
ncbi:MAG TPA: hypothetical protein VH722_16625 [Alphaproteobacteria bacterium]|nr:hypothetical protein [Alphaproteobacteria bacterium]